MTAAAVRPGRSAGAVAVSTGRFRLLLGVGLLLVLLLTGGASRSDEILQLVARLASVLVLLATLWTLKAPTAPCARSWLVVTAAAYLLVSVQLLPLPPAIWASQPGHQPYARIAVLTGNVVWRPLSMTPDLTVNTLFSLLPATALGLASLYLGAAQRRLFWTVVVCGSVVSAIVGMLQIAGGGDGLRLYSETTPHAAVGLFANRNHQMAFLAAAMPLLGALISTNSLRPRAMAGRIVIAASCALIILIGIVLSGARAGLVLGPAGLLFAWLSLRGGAIVRGPSTGKARVAIGVGLAGVLLLILAVGQRSGVFDRVAGTNLSSESRALTIAPVSKTAEAFMPLGSGFGSFSAVYRGFEPDSLLSTIYLNEAHNEPLQLAVEGGLPALLFLAIFLIWWGRAAAAIILSNVTDSRQPLAIAAVGSTFILMAESLVDYPLRTPLLGSLFVVACLEMARAQNRARTVSNSERSGS